MKRLRPLAGVLLATVLLAAVATAAEVEKLRPGGSSESQSGFSAAVELISPGTTNTGPVATRRSSSGDSSEPSLQTRHFGAQFELTCALGEAPHAIVVVNHSEDPLPAGTRIKWQLTQEGLRGFFKLLGTLEGGATLVADNVLETTVNRGADCVARVI
jgi:hypothetical protein